VVQLRKNRQKLPPPEAKKATSWSVAVGYLCTPQNVETMILDLKEIVEMLTAPAWTTLQYLQGIHNGR
jgi:hypothetical protein